MEISPQRRKGRRGKKDGKPKRINLCVLCVCGESDFESADQEKSAKEEE
jgi:hypothetical protein